MARVRPKTAAKPLPVALQTMSTTDESELSVRVETADDLDRELNRVSTKAWITDGSRASVRFRGRDVERLLGRGAMGGVFLARSPELDRHVALKLISRHGISEEHLAREARALAQIDHRNVVKVHAIDLEGPTGMIEMEYVDGVRLGQWIRTGPKTRAIVQAYAAAGDGLVAIHEAGLVHRDVKPDNVLRRDDGRVVVVDLGLALEDESSADAKTAGRNDRGPGPGTRIAGTPGYMAPEVVMGQRPTGAADQFSLACSLYESLGGALPFDPHGTRDDFLTGVRAGPPRSGPAAAPRWLRRVLRRALAFEPHHRFPSMDAFVRALQEGLGRPKRWWRLGGLSSTALAVGALGWTVASQPAPCPPPSNALSPAWSDDAARQVGDILVHADPTAGPHALGLLTDALDRAQGRWAANTAAVCHAERADQPTGQRHACLQSVEATAAAHVRAIETREVDPLGAAVLAAEEIERLPSCSELSLETPSRAPWTDARESELRARLLDAWNADVLGRYQAAHDALDAILDDARDLPRVQARALFQRGHLYGSQDQARTALQSLDAARTLAFADGDDRLLCEVLAYQAKVQVQLAADPGAAERELQLATACLERIGDHSGLPSAELLEARGLHAQRARRPNDAIALHTEALELRRRALGADHVVCAKSLHNLGNAWAGRGDLVRSRVALEQALQIRMRVFGEHHPRVANILFDLGDVQRQQGRLDLARESLSRALEIYADEESNAESLGLTHLALAQVALAEGDTEATRKHLDQSSAYNGRESLDAAPLWIADRLHTEGALLVRERDFEAARARFATATELLRRHDGKDSAVYDSTLRELEMLFGLKQHQRIAARVVREEPWLSRHMHTLEPSERGRFAWYIALSAEQSFGALSPIDYWRSALDAYRELDDPLSSQELHWGLARALASDEDTRSEALQHASAALTIEGGPPTRRSAIAAWISEHTIQKAEQ